ncbi:MAG: hypothetical protein JST83_10080 [Bacteroidetes bacterium]|nr:hypothetical protein [Bacteroidota bacterium]
MLRYIHIAILTILFWIPNKAFSVCDGNHTIHFTVDYTVQKPSSSTAQDGIINLKIGIVDAGHWGTPGNAQLMDYAPYAKVTWYNSTGQVVGNDQHLIGVGKGIYTAQIAGKDFGPSDFKTRTINIAVDDANAILNVSTTNSSGFNNSDGSASFSVINNGNAVSLSNISSIELDRGSAIASPTTNTISGLNSVYHNLVVTLSNGVVLSKSIYIYSSNSLSISPAIADAMATGTSGVGNITPHPSGGQAPYTYSWCNSSTGGSLSSVVVSDHSIGNNNILYTTTITDAVGKLGYCDVWINGSTYLDDPTAPTPSVFNSQCSANTGSIVIPAMSNEITGLSALPLQNFVYIYVRDVNTGFIIRQSRIVNNQQTVFSNLAAGTYDVLFYMGSENFNSGGSYKKSTVTIACSNFDYNIWVDEATFMIDENSCSQYRIELFMEKSNFPANMAGPDIFYTSNIPFYYYSWNNTSPAYVTFTQSPRLHSLSAFDLTSANQYLTSLGQPTIDNLWWTDWNNQVITFGSSGFNPAWFNSGIQGPITLHVQYTGVSAVYTKTFDIWPHTFTPQITLLQNGDPGSCSGANDGTIHVNVSQPSMLTNLYALASNPYLAVYPSGNNGAGEYTFSCVPNYAPTVDVKARFDNHINTPLTCTAQLPVTGMQGNTSGLGTLTLSVTQNVTCNGNDGIVRAVYSPVNPVTNLKYELIQLTGIGAPHSYGIHSLSGNVYTVDFPNLCFGDYKVTFYDGANTSCGGQCQITQTISVHQPLSVVNHNSQTTEACPGGNGTIVLALGLSGSFSSYTFDYQWSDPSLGNVNTVSVPAGWYTVTATYPGACDYNGYYWVNDEQPHPLYITQSAGASCSSVLHAAFMNPLQAPHNTSLSYAWSYVDATGTHTLAATGLDATVTNPGIYTIDVTDDCSVHHTGQYTVSFSSPAQVTLNLVQPTCFDLGHATAIVAAGQVVSFAYYNSSSTLIGTNASINGLAPGNYTLQVSDPLTGCQQTYAFTINALTSLTATASSSGCGQASATISGGLAPYHLVWAHQTAALYGTVYDPIPDPAPSSPILIHDQSFVTDYDPTVSGNTGNMLTGALAGPYVLTVTDANGCTTSASFSVPDLTTANPIKMAFRWREQPAPRSADAPVARANNEYEDAAQDLIQAISDAVSNCQEDIETAETNAYSTSCLDLNSINDVLRTSYTLHYHHYTLYYYDRAGNLARTVQPEGVHVDNSYTRNDHPDHKYVTTYEHNSLGQVVKQTSPDVLGDTKFIYDGLGRIRFSQNPKQADNNAYSYTKYDNIGRISEVGEATSTGSTLLTTLEGIADNPTSLDPLATVAHVTKTMYSDPEPSVSYFGQMQANLRNRVSYSYSDEDGLNTTLEDRSTTYYSYDPHGNVQWLVQDIGGFTKNYISYEYDLLSNKVKKVSYNEGQPDQFFHKYEYDGDDRLKAVYTSKDGLEWDKDAGYNYYLHGPLQRMELGQDKIQGLDYAYTIHGWLKQINSHDANNPQNDLGKDGYGSSKFLADAYGMELGYFAHDFVNSSNPLGSTSFFNSSGMATPTDLYNGNISWWANSQTVSGGSGSHIPLSVSNYKYDQLNRITDSKYGYNDNGASWTADNSYASSYTYYENGNIRSLTRNGASAQPMDQLTYKYNSGNPPTPNNRLEYVEDVVSPTNFTVDIDNQGAGNYEYDKIGNLTKDVQGNLLSISWTPYGKISKIVKNNSTNTEILFRYDATGNRIAKINKVNPADVTTWDYTYYVRDAQGNIMATYDRSNISTGSTPAYAAIYKPAEVDLYGSSRLGLMDMSNSNITLASVPFGTAADASATSFTRAMLRSKNWSENVVTSYLGANAGGINMSTYSPSTNVFTTASSGSSTLATPHNNIATGEDESGAMFLTGESLKWFNPVTGAIESSPKVFDATGSLVVNSTTLKSAYFTKSVFFRRPGDSRNWYYVTIGEDKQLYIHTIDYNTITSTYSISNQNEAIGPVLDQNESYGHHIAALELPDQDKVYLYVTINRVITGSGYKKELYALEFNEESEQPVAHLIDSKTIAAFNPTVPGNFNYNAYPEGEIQVSSDGSKVLWSYFTSYTAAQTGSASIAMYNMSSDHISVVSSSTPVANIVCHTTYDNSADFSPDGSSIFYNEILAGSDQMSYLNLTSATATPQQIGASGQYGEIRRGKANKMYVSLKGATNNCGVLISGAVAGATPSAAYINIAAATPVVTGPVVTAGLPQSTGFLPTANVILTKPYDKEFISGRVVGWKRYELNDHLGNVRVVLSDKRLASISGSTVTNFADIKSSQDYYPFGMLMPGRQFGSGYRFGFNGKENDNDVKGEGNQQNYGMRIYDPRIAKFLSVDPLTKKYPWNSTYAFAENEPIGNVDLDGAEKYHYDRLLDQNGNTQLKFLKKEDIIEHHLVINFSWHGGLDIHLETIVNPRKEFLVWQKTSGLLVTQYGQLREIPYNEHATFNSYDAASKANDNDFSATEEDGWLFVTQSLNNAAAATREFSGRQFTAPVDEPTTPSAITPYNRRQHYGNTPTKADRKALGASKDEVVDHVTPLVQHYYEGDGKGSKPGYKMTQAERRTFANNRLNMQLQLRTESNKQGGNLSNYSKQMKKNLCTPP